MIAGIGCALPLILGLSSGHPGFLWATLGAFQAARANPLHRFGMLRMLLLISLGASSAALGFWAASSLSISFVLFALTGLILAWLQRFGAEAGKLGLGMALCLCLGQAYPASQELSTPAAVAALFGVGGVWVMLLAFVWRGLNGLRMWPYMPRLWSLLKAIHRHAKRRGKRQWPLHATCCTLAFGLAGLCGAAISLEHSYWLTLTVLGTLHLKARISRSRTLQACSSSLAIAVLLALLENHLHNSTSIATIILPLIVFSRAIQSNSYRWFMLQSIAICLLLSESLTPGSDMLEPRLLAIVYGFIVALISSLSVQLLIDHLRKREQAHLPSDNEQT